MVAVLSSCSSENHLSIEQAKSMVYDYLQKDTTISEVEIYKFEMYKESEDEKIYWIEYSMIPTNPDSYIIAGSRVEGEDGSIQSYEFVTCNKKYEIRFSTSP